MDNFKENTKVKGAVQNELIMQRSLVINKWEEYTCSWMFFWINKVLFIRKGNILKEYKKWYKI